MKQEILEKLSHLTEEEQFILVFEDDASQRSIYTNTKRFVIERRRMSNIIRAGLDPRIIIKEVDWGYGKKDGNELSQEEFQKVMLRAKNS